VTPRRTATEAAEEPQEPRTPAPPPEDTPDEFDGSSEPLRGNYTALALRSLGDQARAGTDPLMPDESDDHPLTVWEAIAEITRQVKAIAKEHTASGSDGGYRFRGIDDVLEALHPLLGEVGLVILPAEVREARFESRATRSGGTLNVARLLIRYRFVGPDGSTITGEAWGEAGDSGDKATQKAHSQSYKTLCLQTFSIPTQGSADDEPDAVNEAARPFTAEEVQRATTAAGAAAGADTYADLAAVRRRALHLLDVPVSFEDGRVAPLSVIFDQRRAELDAGGEQR
jgi:hypothetical protein